MRFKAEFEVVPEIELGEYKDVEVPYSDPEVTEEDVEKRLNEIRDQKAQYVNVDPRPIENGDYAVVALESIGGRRGRAGQAGRDGPGDRRRRHLRSVHARISADSRPGDEKDFEVTYPGGLRRRPAGRQDRQIPRHCKGIRRKDLPELNDEFAQDLGDYRNVDEVRDAIRKGIFAQRQHEAQAEAKNKIVDKLVDAHDFPVPEVFVERQIENRVRAEPARDGRARASTRAPSSSIGIR